jgi:hypothetical protein
MYQLFIDDGADAAQARTLRPAVSGFMLARPRCRGWSPAQRCSTCATRSDAA